MTKTDCCDLLIVEHEKTPVIVEVPFCEADIGDLIRFEDPFGFLKLGQVIDKLCTEPDSDTYRCISILKTICRGVAVYKAAWVAENRMGGVDYGGV